MMGVYLAFVWEDTKYEKWLGGFGSLVLVCSDAFALTSSTLIGLDTSENLGVVILWFCSSIISMSGCVCLFLCYFDWPCGSRLRMYFEMSCLFLFFWAALLEISWGFCPVEDTSPNFFGSQGLRDFLSCVSHNSTGLMFLFGYSLCLIALASEKWSSKNLKCQCRTKPNEESRRLISVGNVELNVNE